MERGVARSTAWMREMRKSARSGRCLARLLVSFTGLALLACPPLGERLVTIDQPAAALAFPFLTGGQDPNPLEGTQGDVIFADDAARTELTISNLSTQTLRLSIDVIDGDPHASSVPCHSLSLVCDLPAPDGNSPWTGRGTTRLEFTAQGDGASLRLSCEDAITRERVETVRSVTGENGIVFVAAASAQTGAALALDRLAGSALVVEVSSGRSVTLPALAFQAGAGANDGDKHYRFDGREYVKWPGRVDTSFLAPEPGVRSELVLFTLDHTLGVTPPPRVKLGGVAQGLRPSFLDFQYEFQCFDVVAVNDIDANLASGSGLGSSSGRLELAPQAVGAGVFDVHDASFGDGNSVRRRPTHGWILEDSAGMPLRGRALEPSSFPLAPFAGDEEPCLEADTRG
jgi:hypothetical protein